MRRLVLFCTAALCLGFTTVLLAQDPVKVDPKHYTVISENDQVRILKIHYGPHEKSVMHSHPATAVVFLSDSKGKFTFPDGKTEDFTTKSGEAMYGPAGTHLPENTGDTPLDGVLVELKGKSASAKAAAAAKPATTAKATKK
ncbi:MAG: secreted protein [Candidatus Acidoferrum typicum]|nr:secreted protein [Candidatus Acidoferrum typicum]